MSASFANRTSEGCFSSLQLDRLLAGELTEGEAERIRVHLAACRRCAAALDEQRAASEERLPPLRVVPLASRARVPVRVVAAAIGLTAAASVLLVVRPRPSTRSKGPGFALSMYVDHQGDVRRAAPGDALAPGDAVRFAVSSPVEVYVGVLSLDAKGHASIYFPSGGRAEAVQAGRDVALPQGTRLDETVGEEQVIGLFCSSSVELEPLRQQLERGAPSIPDGCQVTRWSFVKR
jgi:hypothetical protein